MASLDRSLTEALIANFKDLASSRAGEDSTGEQEAVHFALLRLKGEETRLRSRIRTRELAGGVLQRSLAREDRARLKIVRNSIRQLRDLLGPS
jgi:hypothetical protein